MARFYLNEGQTYLLDIDDLPNALIYRKNKLYSLGKHWLKFFFDERLKVNMQIN